MASLGRILAFTRTLTPLYVAIIVCAVVVALASLAVPFIIGRATDEVVAAVAGDTAAGDAIRTVVLLALALLGCELLSTVASNVGGYWGDVMSARMRSILSTRYYEKLLTLPQRYFDNELTGTIVARLNRSITEITNFMKSFSNSFFTMLITTVAVLGISAWYSWPLALLLFTVFPVYLWLTARTSVHWQGLEAVKNTDVDIASGRFSEVVGQIRVVKSFARERGELDAFDDRFHATVDTTRAQSRHWHRLDIARRAVLNLVFFAVYAIIFVQTVNGEFSIGTMVLLIQLMNMARQPVTMMSFVIDSAQRAIAGSTDYFAVMAEQPDRAVPQALARREQVPATRGEQVPAARGQEVSASGSAAVEERHQERLPRPAAGEVAVSFRDVTFGYDAGADVLSGISFDVRAGEKVAFVGESGGGKTTIVNLLLGLYRLRGGVVEVLGRDVQDVPVDVLRRSIGVVFQEPSLFSGTIRENIAYGRPGATDDEIVAAAHRANAHEFVSRFPGGYDTLIGERGLKLSGGQKQRIAVARAMLKDAPLLVLDEATSALDTKSERLVQDGLEQLMADRTSLIIAHRLSTISTVDRIVTLRDGRVDEIGSPADLAESGGIYAELLALQNSASRADRRRLRQYDLR